MKRQNTRVFLLITYLLYLGNLFFTGELSFLHTTNCHPLLGHLFLRWLIIGFVTRLTRRVPLVEQELPTLPEYLSSPQVFVRVHVIRSLLLCVCFVDRSLSFCAFSFGHYVVCSSSIYEIWPPLWYLQTLLKFSRNTKRS